MEFLWPKMLWLLLLLPLLLWGYVWLQRRRRKAAERAGGLGLLRSTARHNPGARRHITPALFLVGLAILIVALARPQAAVSLPRVEGTVMLVFDVSNSMSAIDVEPSRLEAAKAAAHQFVQNQPSSVKIGVVAFSDSSFTLQAPTNEQDTILAAIDRLGPERSTSLAQGIIAALTAIAVDAGQDPQPQEHAEAPSQEGPVPLDERFLRQLPEGSFPSAVILLFSDGENTEAPEPLEAAQASAERQVRIYTVGVGTPGGTTIEVDGFTVHTRLDEAALQAIASMTGGAYYYAGGGQDLGAVYKEIVPQLVVKPDQMEVTSIFAGASLLVLLVGSLFSARWFSRLP